MVIGKFDWRTIALTSGNFGLLQLGLTSQCILFARRQDSGTDAGLTAAFEKLGNTELSVVGRSGKCSVSSFADNAGSHIVGILKCATRMPRLLKTLIAVQKQEGLFGPPANTFGTS